MLRIRLSRTGRKNLSQFRFVVAQKTAPIKGRVIEIIGSFNPHRGKEGIAVKEDRLKYWLSVGAQPTDTVNNLLVDAKILPDKQRIKKSSKKKSHKKEEKPEKPAVIESPAAPQVQAGSLMEEAPEEEKKEEAKSVEESKPAENKEATPEPAKEANTEKPEK